MHPDYNQPAPDEVQILDLVLAQWAMQIQISDLHRDVLDIHGKLDSLLDLGRAA